MTRYTTVGSGHDRFCHCLPQWGKRGITWGRFCPRGLPGMFKLSYGVTACQAQAGQLECSGVITFPFYQRTDPHFLPQTSFRLSLSERRGRSRGRMCARHPEALVSLG